MDPHVDTRISEDRPFAVSVQQFDEATASGPLNATRPSLVTYRVFRLIGGVYTIIGAFCQKTQARATLPIG